MTIRTALTAALSFVCLAGLAAPVDAQVYNSPNFGIGVSSSYYYSSPTRPTPYTNPNSGYVIPSAYNYTTPTTRWYQTGYTYPVYGTTTTAAPSHGYTGTRRRYPTHNGMGYYPTYTNGHYGAGHHNNSAVGTPYNTYTTVRRRFRR